MKVRQMQGTIEYQHKQVPRLILISGKLQSGKDTTLKILNFIHKYRISPDLLNLGKWDDILASEPKKESFAKPVKEMTSILVVGYIREDIHSEAIKNELIVNGPWAGKTWREMFIWVGTTVFRKEDQDVWIKSLVSRIGETTERVYITDCRFVNEADTQDKTNALVIRVDKDEDVVDILNPNIDPIKKNQSETDLDTYQRFHCIIQNHGNLHDLYVKVWLMYKHYKLNLELGSEYDYAPSKMIL